MYKKIIIALSLLSFHNCLSPSHHQAGFMRTGIDAIKEDPLQGLQALKAIQIAYRDAYPKYLNRVNTITNTMREQAQDELESEYYSTTNPTKRAYIESKLKTLIAYR